MAIDYKPMGWSTADYINPTNMNHMDDGIKAACDGVDALNIEVEAVNEVFGNTDISHIADGTLTGGLSAVNENIINTPLASILVNLSTESDINNYYDSISNNMALDTKYTRYVNHSTAHSILGAGIFVLEGCIVNRDYEWQRVISYSFGETIREFTRIKKAGVWCDWNVPVTNSDLEWKLLGTLTKNSNTLALPTNFKELYVYIKYSNSIGTQIIIPKSVLTATTQFFSNGYYATSYSQMASAVVCSLTKIVYVWVYADGVEIDDATMIVYYR